MLGADTALRVAGSAFVCACAFGLASSAPAAAVSSSQIVATINAERQANGIPTVREDPALSAGCAQYDNYRRQNGSLRDAFTPGAESPSNPGYSAAGARASRDSILNAGDRPADSFANGDVFDDAPNHLQPLMDPAVAVIGADQLDFDAGAFFGTASLACVNVRSAPRRVRPRRLRAYAYVGPGGKAARNPSYREGPGGSGPFVFLYFDAPKRAHLALRSLTVHRRDGSVITPSYLRLTGGLADGRRARSANAGGNGPSPAVVIRLVDALQDAEVFANWRLQLRIEARSLSNTGQVTIPFAF